MDRSISQAFLSILGSRIGKIGLGFLITPVLVRLLGSSQYGDYALILSAFGILSTLVHSGSFNGIRKYIAEDRDYSGRDDYIFAFYTRISILLSILVGIILAILIYFGLIERVFGKEFELYFILLFVYICLYQIYSLARGVLMGFGLESQSEPLQVIERGLFGLIAICLIYLGWGVSGALVGMAISITVVGFAAIYLVQKRIELKSILAVIPSDIPKKELLEFHINSILLAFLTISLYHVDIILLQPIAGSEQTGYYKAALVVAEFLWLVPMAIQYTLVQSVSRLWSNGKKDRVNQIATRSTRYTLAFTALLIVGLASLADSFIPLYFGSEFTPAILPLLILLPGTLGFAVARPIFAIGQGIGDLRIVVAATGIASILNLLLNLFLIPRYGMYGAAVATSIGYGSMLALHIVSSLIIGFNPISDVRLGRILSSVVITFPITFGLAQYIQNDIVSLLLVPPVGFLVYLAASIKFRVIKTSEIDEIANQLPKLGRKTLLAITDYL